MPISSRISKKRARPDAGNVFLALFGAVAVAGLLGGALSIVIKGPLSSAVSLTRTNTAEAQMALAGRSVVMAAASAANKGDCDADGMVEPWEWRDAGSLPKPDGGGLIPDGLVTNPKDPWGTDYGYCVWDHGSTVLSPGCQGTSGTNRRLAGANVQNQPSVAIVSAGPDKKFGTKCISFAAADRNSDGVLDQVNDDPLIVKVGGISASDDDIVFANTYAEAAGLSGGLWKLTENVTAASCNGLGYASYSDPVSGNCFWAVNEGTNTTWNNAKAACTAAGGFLASITTASENAGIAAMITQSSYFGGTDAVVDGEWRWTGGPYDGQMFWQGFDTGTNINGLYSKWAASRPRTSPNTNCTYMGVSGGVWYDVGCTSSSLPGYVCEKAKTVGATKAAINKTLDVTGGASFTETGLFSKIGRTDPLAKAYVFIANTYVSANTGGLSGADNQCQMMASTAGLPGTYKAWLSDSTASVKSRFTHLEVPYVLVNDAVIADNWTDLTDGSIARPINLTATGSPASGNIWTGTNSDGTTNGADQCNNWTSSSTSNTARLGSAGNSNLTTWTNNNLDGLCNAGSFRFYCFQQGNEIPALEVQSGLKLASQTAMPTCNTANKGAVRQNTDGTGIQICDGANWAAIGSPPTKEFISHPTFDTGYSHTCALSPDGSSWCWGTGDGGQAGDNNASGNKLNPVKAQGGHVWVELTAGNGMTCGIKSDGKAYCWGANDYGQQGDGTTAKKLVPTQLPDNDQWIHLTAGDIHGCGIKADKTAWCWGDNTSGQLGRGNNVGGVPAPVITTGLNTWSEISAGSFFTCGIKTDGSLWCWGGNGNGNLGDNSTAERDNPVPVAAGATFTSISAGYTHACAVKSDGTGWCWGSNEYGKIGDNTTTLRKVPKEFAPGSKWKQISAGQNHSCGIKDDGTPWCWGYNDWGYIGDNTTTTRKVPTAVTGSIAPVIAISAANQHSCAMREDGKIYCWGFGYYGNLGQGTQNNSYVPITQTGDPTWQAPPDGDSGNFPLLAPNGSVSAPSYSFASSSTSGLWYSGTALKLKSAGQIDITSLGQANLSGPTSDFRFSTNGLKIGSDSGICAAALKGTVRYNNSSKRFESCNGTAWVDF